MKFPRSKTFFSFPSSVLLQCLLVAVANFGTTTTSLAQPGSSPEQAASDSMLSHPTIGLKQWPELSRVFHLSPDGKWLSYCWTVRGEPESDQSVIVVQEVDGDLQLVIEAPKGMDAPFSSDSRSVLVPTRNDQGMVVSVYELPSFRLAAEFRNPRQIELSKAFPEFVMLYGCSEYVTSTGEIVRPGKNDLVVYSTSELRVRRYPSVQQFKRSPDSRSFAYVHDVAGQSWELLLVDHASENRVILDTGKGSVAGLAWGNNDECLGYSITGNEARNSLIILKNVSSGKPVRVVLDSQSVADWPDGKSIDAEATLQIFSEGRFVGIALTDRDAPRNSEQTKVKDEEVPEIWRTSQSRLPTERVDARARQRYFETSGLWQGITHVWDTTRDALTELADPSNSGAAVFGSESIAFVRNQTPYAGLRSRGVFFYDLLVKDLLSGKERLLRERAVGQLEPAISPSGRFVVEYGDAHWTLHDVRENTTRRLTTETAEDFGQQKDSRMPVKAEWLSDGRTVLLHDRGDLWSFHVDPSSSAKRITDGHATGRRYSFVEEGDDGAIYFLFEVLQTKNTGISVLRDDKLVDLFQCDGKCDVDVRRANDRLAIRFEKHDVPANIAVVDETQRHVVFESHLRAGRLAADHSQRDVIGYQAPWGERLQATLDYPRKYSPQQKYPMIVLVFRRESKENYGFETAASNSYLNPASWARKGFFVLRPDMAEQVGDPGRSSVKCLEAALDEVASIGTVDMHRVVIIGASHGGYLTLMALCTSDRFAAGVAVNSITDSATFSADLYEDHGETNLGWALVANRMAVPFWDDPSRYIANSPLYLVKGMNTPLLLGVGKKDDNVNWRQSLYFFNALRALGKPAEMVLYPEFGHGFAFPQFRKRVDQFLSETLKRQE